MPNSPIIPQNITVHLGPPSSNAENVTLPFLDYVANVASSEIYPTWPENAVRANMYAQISFALNRIYTEYYRTQGYDFDITNSTANDQSFVHGRVIFENIRELAGQLFDSYLRRPGSIEPLFAQYCDGIEVQCQGLSQWGSVPLAEAGYTPYEILQNYYGDNIEIVNNVPVEGNELSAPLYPLQVGSTGDEVRVLQIRLNRISNNFPAIPKILETDGIFAEDTDAAVRKFQEVFNLTPDGIVGKTTWYTVQNIYIGVKRLNSLESEGISLEEITRQYPGALQLGSRGGGVRALQYYLAYLAEFYDTIPPVNIDGDFGESTKEAVIAAQKTFGLPPDGIVGETTWYALSNAYFGIISTIPREFREGVVVPYGGVPLRIGSESNSVILLQEYLNVLSEEIAQIPPVSVTGYFGPATQESVLAAQAYFGIPATGVVASETWNAITSLYESLTIGTRRNNNGQYPGFDIGRDT